MDDLTDEQARVEEREALEHLAEGRVIPHERMKPYLEALFAGEKPPQPETDRELCDKLGLVWQGRSWWKQYLLDQQGPSTPSE